MAKLIRRLQRTNKDQYLLTTPKHLVDLLNWHDKAEIEFGFTDGRITLKARKPGFKKGKLSRRLQMTNKNQYLLTIPKHLVDLLNWQQKSSIEFGFSDGKITLKARKPEKKKEVIE